MYNIENPIVVFPLEEYEKYYNLKGKHEECEHLKAKYTALQDITKRLYRLYEKFYYGEYVSTNVLYRDFYPTAASFRAKLSIEHGINLTEDKERVGRIERI